MELPSDFIHRHKYDSKTKKHAYCPPITAQDDPFILPEYDDLAKWELETYLLDKDDMKPNHIGHRKCLIAELQAILECDSAINGCIMAGSAPGDHIPFLAALFPDITFVVIDTLPFAFKPAEVRNVTILDKLLTPANAHEVKAIFGGGGKVLFLSDIRSGNSTKIDLKFSQVYRSQEEFFANLGLTLHKDKLIFPLDVERKYFQQIIGKEFVDAFFSVTEIVYHAMAGLCDMIDQNDLDAVLEKGFIGYTTKGGEDTTWTEAMYADFGIQYWYHRFKGFQRYTEGCVLLPKVLNVLDGLNLPPHDMVCVGGGPCYEMLVLLPFVQDHGLTLISIDPHLAPVSPQIGHYPESINFVEPEIYAYKTIFFSYSHMYVSEDVWKNFSKSVLVMSCRSKGGPIIPALDATHVRHSLVGANDFRFSIYLPKVVTDKVPKHEAIVTARRTVNAEKIYPNIPYKDKGGNSTRNELTERTNQNEHEKHVSDDNGLVLLLIDALEPDYVSSKFRCSTLTKSDDFIDGKIFEQAWTNSWTTERRIFAKRGNNGYSHRNYDLDIWTARTVVSTSLSRFASYPNFLMKLGPQFKDDLFSQCHGCDCRDCYIEASVLLKYLQSPYAKKGITHFQTYFKFDLSEHLPPGTDILLEVANPSSLIILSSIIKTFSKSVSKLIPTIRGIQSYSNWVASVKQNPKKGHKKRGPASISLSREHA